MSKTVQQQHMKSLLPNKEKNNNIDARSTACENESLCVWFINICKWRTRE